MLLRLFHIIVIFFALNVNAQGTLQTGILPSISVNKSFLNTWKANFKIESRQQTLAHNFSTDETNEYSYILTDYSLIVAKKIGLSSSVSGGYLLRFRNNQIHHRFIQQYVIVKNYDKFRLAHRVCMDETITPSTFISRGRYRLTAEIPLNGYSIDAKECYLKINHEYLNQFQNKNYDLEIRLIPMLGYKISDKNKIEAGFDYRINNFISSLPNHKLWLTVGWHVSI